MAPLSGALTVRALWWGTLGTATAGASQSLLPLSLPNHASSHGTRDQATLIARNPNSITPFTRPTAHGPARRHRSRDRLSDPRIARLLAGPIATRLSAVAPPFDTPNPPPRPPPRTSQPQRIAATDPLALQQTCTTRIVAWARPGLLRLALALPSYWSRCAPSSRLRPAARTSMNTNVSSPRTLLGWSRCGADGRVLAHKEKTSTRACAQAPALRCSTATIFHSDMMLTYLRA